MPDSTPEVRVSPAPCLTRSSLAGDMGAPDLAPGSWGTFVLKSILSDMSIATPAFFWSLFAWKIFFQPFTFSLYVSPVLRWVSCRQHI